MVEITITLTEEEYKALACEAMDVEEYLQNYANVRAENALKRVVQEEVERRLDVGEPVPSSRKEIIMDAKVKTAKEKEKDIKYDLV